MAEKAKNTTTSSNKVKDAVATTVQAKPEDKWRSGRARFGLQRFRQGSDHKWHFSGQEPGEEVKLIVHKHWWFLVQPGLPFLGSLALLFFVVWGSIGLQSLGAIWYLLDAITIVLVVGTGAWFAWKDLVVWWLETSIITNKRIINSSGLLQPKRQITGLEKVQQVSIELKPLGAILGFGLVHAYLTGGDLYLRDVADPKKVKDALVGITEEIKSKKPKEKPLPVPADPELAAMLKTLSQGKEPKPLEDADENYYKRDKDGKPIKDDRLLGPMRTFGGVLRIPCQIRYTSGEYTVRYIQRSQYVLLRNLLIPALLLLFILPLAVVAPTVGFVPESFMEYWIFLMGLIVLGILISVGVLYINYVDDIYILTNKRIIDVERKLVFAFESRIETEYKNIRDIRVTVANVLERFLDIGNIYIETPGSKETDIIFENVDHPFILQDQIATIRSHKDSMDKAKKETEEKKLLYTWFSQVMVHLEDKGKQVENKIGQAPPLKGLDLLSAIARAQELGLDVTVWGEDIATSEVPPGHVLHQNPPPGTLVGKGTRIEVVLGKKPSLVDQL